MKRALTLLVATALFVSLVGCAATVPVNATSNPVGSKVGEAETTAILGFFFDGGDASIKTAAQNGGISEISTVDIKGEMVFLNLVKRYTTIVTGE
ncbi:MAG: TRL domain-containing protein [Fibrobacterota bacterium]